MVIDSSALVAVLLDEPDGPEFRRLITTAFPRLVAAPSVVEASLVLIGRKGEGGPSRLARFLEEAVVETVAFDARQAAIAIQAFDRFGKGRHAASLNFGDCFSYALAKATGEPLLFKGRDLAATDLRAAA